MSDNHRKLIPREEALAVAKELYDRLSPFTEKCKVVGSLRRYRKFVHDIELLFIPKTELKREGLFPIDDTLADRAELTIDRWEREGFLKKRPNVRGSFTWGKQNKLAIHTRTGIPVDLFSTTVEKWWVALVIRTGGKITNLQLTKAALARGLTLHAYGSGFERLSDHTQIPCSSEQDVFRIAGIPYVAPQYRP